MDRRKFLGISAAAAAAAASLPNQAAAQSGTSGGLKLKAAGTGKTLRRIATEEAFSIPEQLELMSAAARGMWDHFDLNTWLNRTAETPLQKRLALEGDRLKIMDENGVAMHVLSLTSPGVQVFDADTAVRLAEVANDKMAELISRYPSRFAGLASFAPQDPKRAVKEMERAIHQLKLNGFVVNSHTHNEYLDDQKFWPILEAAEALDRAIYIHPRSPSDLMREPYAKYGLDKAVWGYQAETGLHAVRMILASVFDRFPKLKIVLGHMGESIPYNLWRLNYMYNAHKGRRSPLLKTEPAEVFKRNFMITTSGVEDHAVLKFCIEKLGVDNIMWAIDYPYQPTEPAVAFMDSAPVSRQDLEKLYFRNAERVFHIKT
jgi:5-carboxyvanillate decarboxylase